MFRPDTIRLTALLGLLTAFGPLATDMYVPSMPDIGRLLGASAGQVQLTLSSYLVGIAVGQIIYGPLSDRYGRRPVLLAALVLFCAASLACAIAPNIGSLIIARALQALGGAGAVVLPRAVVRDLYSGEQAGRELSRISAVMSFAPIIAPLIGGVVQTTIGWRANFAIIVAIGLFTSMMTWRAMPETAHLRSTELLSIANVLRGYGTLARNRTFLFNLGIIAFSYAGLFAWISGSPFVLQGLYGLSPLEFSIAFAISCVGSVAGAALGAFLVVRIGLELTIGLGTLALAAGGLSMLATLALGLAPVGSLVISMALYHTGLMLAMPPAIAGAMTPFPNRAGAASSLVGVVQQMSAAMLGAVIGYTLGKTAWPMAGAVATMGCLALTLWVISGCAMPRRRLHDYRVTRRSWGQEPRLRRPRQGNDGTSNSEAACAPDRGLVERPGTEFPNERGVNFGMTRTGRAARPNSASSSTR
jgi:MFS transporter, DHA1 family, multidrug resistance protein